ncbi:MAG: SDR family oxidoreductase [Chitinophagales bacterium]|nr:SDR family oxidoreductase [Chitinophagales bacterium]
MKILVTGATGHFGKANIDLLLKKGYPATSIAALVRDESKAGSIKATGVEIRTGDYEDYSSLVKAFSGIDKLLLVSSNDLNNRSAQQANAVKAAREAGVNYILYTSFVRKDESEASPIAFVSQSHIATEELIRESGLAYTIFRNNLYLDYVPVFIGDKVLENGIYWPAGTTPGAYALREEMAESAANVLTGNGHENKTYNISNTRSWTFQEVAGLISKITGKEISYFSPSQQEYKSTLSQAGVPGQYITMFAGFAEAIRLGEFDSAADSDLDTLLGRTPTSLEAYLEKVYGNR